MKQVGGASTLATGSPPPGRRTVEPTLFGPRGSGRDWELVHYVGRHGAVAMGHVIAGLQLGRTAAYRLVAACIEGGLIERLDLLRGEPALLRATREGLRYVGLGLDVARVSPGSVPHWLACATVALQLRAAGAPRLMTAREIRLEERIAGRAIASAKLGHHARGTPRLHRPDLAVWNGSKPIAIEVELTPKAPARLAAIVRGWRRAEWVEGITYFCAPGPTRGAVERAVDKTRAGNRVRVTDLTERFE